MVSELNLVIEVVTLSTWYPYLLDLAKPFPKAKHELTKIGQVAEVSVSKCGFQLQYHIVGVKY